MFFHTLLIRWPIRCGLSGPLSSEKTTVLPLSSEKFQLQNLLSDDDDVIGPLVRETDDEVNIELAPFTVEVDVALCCC